MWEAARGKEAPERELGLEHRLPLQPGALPDEQVVVVSLEGRFVDVKHLVAEMQGHAAKGEHKPCCKHDGPRSIHPPRYAARTHAQSHSPAIGPFDDASVALFNLVPLLVALHPPPNGVLHLRRGDRATEMVNAKMFEIVIEKIIITSN